MPFLDVHRRDSVTVLALLAIVGACLVALFYDAGFEPQATPRHAVPRRKAPAAVTYATAPRAVRLRPFDPNTADSATLLGLGLAPWQVRAIYRYRAKGGVYMRRDDFARLPGLTAGKFRELRPYITIGADYRPAADVYGPPRHGRRHVPSQQPFIDTLYPRKITVHEAVLLNHADSAQLRHVPGIGPVFAFRIVRYRERLGGYVSREQLLEIDNFPPEALPFFHIQEGEPVRRLNINRSSAAQLRAHPYISWMMARQILDYRRMRGAIHDIDDLRLLPTFSAPVRERLRPYLDY